MFPRAIVHESVHEAAFAYSRLLQRSFSDVRGDQVRSLICASPQPHEASGVGMTSILTLQKDRLVAILTYSGLKSTKVAKIMLI